VFVQTSFEVTSGPSIKLLGAPKYVYVVHNRYYLTGYSNYAILCKRTKSEAADRIGGPTGELSVEVVDNTSLQVLGVRACRRQCE